METNNPLLVDTGRGFSVYYRGIWLYSRYDPAKGPESNCAAVKVMPETLYLVFSPVLCYGLPQLLQKLPASSAILAVEADERLMQLASEASVQLRQHFANLFMVRTDDREILLNYAAKLGPYKRIQTVRISGGSDLHRQFYADCHERIAEFLATNSRNRLSAVRMGRLWTKNIINNLAELDWTEVCQPPADPRPVLVAGAGPSLRILLPLIRKFRPALHLLACDTAIGSLLEAGIVPDSVVCLEGQIHNIHDFLPLNARPVPLWIDLSAHPASFRNLRGPKILLSSTWSENRFLQRLRQKQLPLQVVPPLGSVGVLALHIAGRYFGNDIGLAGLDFSHPPGQTHCTGSPVYYHEKQRECRFYRHDYSWRSSYHGGAHKLGNNCITNSVLEMYAGLARHMLGDFHRQQADRAVVDLRFGQGIALGLPSDSRQPDRLDSRQIEDRFGTWLAGQPDRAADDFQPKPVSDPSTAGGLRSAARDFLQNELELVRMLRRMLGGSESSDGLPGLLADMDYLYCSFPDADRVTNMEIDALNRLTQEAVYWAGRLEAAVAAISRTD